MSTKQPPSSSHGSPASRFLLKVSRLKQLVHGKAGPFLTYGNAARDNRQYAVAAVFYEEALKRDPRNAAIHIQCGHMHKEAGDFAAAARHYARARRLTPRDPDLHLQLGHFLKLQGRLAEAAAAYRRAMVLLPGWTEPQQELTGLAARLTARLAKEGESRPGPAATSGLPAQGAAAASLPGNGRVSLRLNDGRLEELQIDLGGAGAVSAPVAAVPHAPAIPHNAAAPPSPALPQFGNLDGIAGVTAMGWAWDPAKPDQAAEVEFLVDDEVIATCTADLKRDDVKQLGYGNGFNGFRCKLPISVVSRSGIEVRARLKRNGAELRGSPSGRQTSRSVEKWLTRGVRLSKRSGRRLRERLDAATRGQMLSIVMPVYNTRHDWLRCMLDSIRAQWCGNWELVCVDDCSTDPAILPLLHDYARRDTRIRIIESDVNGGIARSTNKGIQAALGDYIAFVDHDDYVEPDAVYKLLRAAQTGAELIYSDEAITEEDIDVIETVTSRPAFSYDFYLSHPYFVHIVCVQRRLALALGGWNESLRISGDVDFVLRVIEKAGHVAHIPAILYRWRTHADSAGHQAKAAVTAAMTGVLRDHLHRTGTEAVVREGLDFNQYRIGFKDRLGRTLVVIPTRNRVDLLRTAIESIRRTVAANAVRIVVIDHESDDPRTLSYLASIVESCEVMRYKGVFNYSAMNNRAVEAYKDGCDYILFANNDIEATEDGWLDSMRCLAGRPEVGVVGATLLYPDSTIQHAGVVIGINGLADHAHRLQPLMLTEDRRFPGHGQSLVSVRDYSAVTAACMMVRTAVFEEVGGFDELQVVGFNDTDLCLRIGEAGYKILMDPYAVLFHYESATRSKSDQLDHPDDSRKFRSTWRKLIAAGDPFYSPMLELNGPDHRLGLSERTDRRIGRVRVRPVVLAGKAG